MLRRLFTAGFFLLMMTAYKHLLPESTFPGLQTIEKGLDKIVSQAPVKAGLEELGNQLRGVPEASTVSRNRVAKGPVWRFEGHVVDMLREQPVPNARVTFSNKAAGEAGTKTTVCDDWGYFRIAMPVLTENAYSVRVEHPDYIGQVHWTRDVLKKPRQERYLLGSGYGELDAAQSTYRGSDDITEVDLYTYPRHLTSREERVKASTFRKYRVGG